MNINNKFGEVSDSSYVTTLTLLLFFPEPHTKDVEEGDRKHIDQVFNKLSSSSHDIQHLGCILLSLQFSKQRFIREGVNGNVHKILNLDGDNEKGGGSAGYKGRRSRISRMATSVDVNGVEQSKMQFDSTGMFHWCPSRDLSSCLMDRQEAAMTVLQVKGLGFSG